MDGGRGRRAKLLYWFRTPVGARVGRSPLDPDAIRALEESHPDIHFDWPALLEERSTLQERFHDDQPQFRRERSGTARRDQEPSAPAEVTRDARPEPPDLMPPVDRVVGEAVPAGPVPARSDEAPTQPVGEGREGRHRWRRRRRRGNRDRTAQPAGDAGPETGAPAPDSTSSPEGDGPEPGPDEGGIV
jgi:hypothetical protein